MSLKMKNHPGKIMEKRGNVDTKKTQTRNKLKSLFFKAGGRPDSKFKRIRVGLSTRIVDPWPELNWETSISKTINADRKFLTLK